VQVVVDFTHLEAARENLLWLAANGIHAVTGTTGFSDDDYQSFNAAYTSSNCVIAPNFAVGAVLMMRFAELAAPYFETAEIIELHHDAKLDAPSGTAMLTAERMAAASADWAPDPTRTELLSGARGGEGPAGIRVHSLRLRGMVAHQEVILGTTGQTLTIRHDSYDRDSFMPGVVLAVKAVADRPGVTIGLDALLDL
jgi:4-hydroxy-tetrahydrodipicolinate reductase